MYVIYNEKEGFMYDDELSGLRYSFEIDEYTLVFDDEETAVLNKYNGDLIFKIVDAPSDLNLRVI